MIDFLLQVFRESRDKDAIVWRDKVYDYGWLEQRVAHWRQALETERIPRGAVVILEADFSPDSVALFLALTEHACILVPLTSSVEAKKAEFFEIAQGEVAFSVDANDEVRIRRLAGKATHEFYQRLRAEAHPGLVLFSSGSTGKSKAAVHDLGALLDKFKTRRHSLRTITFLLYDHIGGVNTMLYTLSNAGCIVTVHERSPDGVLAAVAKQRVELLPTSPTFINLVLLSEAYRRHDLGSLKTVTYGTEPMPESTLKRFHQLFPGIQLLQTYGLSEVGILRSKSRSSDSLWVKIGGEGFETRVVDNVLQIKAKSAMLGYLNAPSPFTADGWFNTGDAVEVDGDYLRILGRKSEIINVGGEKVYPAEVESCLQEMPNVAEVTIYGEKNPITGSIVCARLRLQQPEPLTEVRKRLRLFCKEKLAPFKIPAKIVLTDEKLFSERFKKSRVVEAGAGFGVPASAGGASSNGKPSQPAEAGTPNRAAPSCGNDSLTKDSE
jgi:acyl-coenzyme A synthetase/AMP-(fatty) acid ligase